MYLSPPASDSQSVGITDVHTTPGSDAVVLDHTLSFILDSFLTLLQAPHRTVSKGAIDCLACSHQPWFSCTEVVSNSSNHTYHGMNTFLSPTGFLIPFLGQNQGDFCSGNQCQLGKVSTCEKDHLVLDASLWRGWYSLELCSVVWEALQGPKTPVSMKRTSNLTTRGSQVRVWVKAWVY